MKTRNKRELHQITTNHSPDNEFELFESFTAVPYSFLLIDTILPLDNPLSFRQNLIKTIYNIS